MQKLLGLDEQPAFSVINSNGKAPLMIACDHASNDIPEVLMDLGLAPALKALHIAYDIGAKQVATLLAEKFDAPLLLAGYSRLVLDLNRHPGHIGMFPEVSDSHIIPGNTGLTDWQKQQRMEVLFMPYHQKHGEMVDHLKQTYQKPIILSVHSFTDVFQGFVRPWHFGVLWDKDQALAIQLLQNFHQHAKQTDSNLVIGDNQPYHALEPLGYSLIAHAINKKVEIAMLEIRQDLVADNVGQQWAADIIFNVLNPLLDWTRI